MNDQRMRDIQDFLAIDVEGLQHKQKIKIRIGAIVAVTLILPVLLYIYYLLALPPSALKAEEPTGYEHLFSIYGFNTERLGRPSDVAVAHEGDIYVADTDNHRIVVFGKMGKFKRQHRNYGKGEGQFEYPNAIDVANNGNIYLISKTLNKLMIMSPTFQTIREIEVDRPIEVKVHGNRIFVATYRGIIQADLYGNLISGFGERGPDRGQFEFPRGLAVDEEGNLYVADSLNYRVQALTEKGTCMWAVGEPHEDIMAAERRFSLPVSIELADDGYLYLVDAFASEIFVLDTEGKQLGRYGEWGHDEGFFYYPGGMAYAGDEKFAIADTYNNRVQIVRIPSPSASLLRRVAPPSWLWPIILSVVVLLANMMRRYWRQHRSVEASQDVAFRGSH